MTQPPVRGVWLDAHTHVALVEYAWLNRTTMSEVFRRVLDDIGSKPVDESILETPDRTGRRRLVVKTNDEQWEAASRAAAEAGIGFHSLIRRHIIKALMDEGLLE